MKIKNIFSLTERTKPLITTLMSVLLLPACIGATEGFTNLIINDHIDYNYRYFPLGAIAYLLVFILFNKPIRTYVFGHELTHALATLLFKGEVKSFSATANGGCVVVSKTNIIIILAPYFFPLYTFIIILGHFILAGFFNMTMFFPVFIFLAGFSFCFHLILTAYMLFLGQQDIKEFGTFFSLTFIYLFNIFSLCIIAAFISPQIDLDEIYITLYKYIQIRYINLIT